MTTSTRRTNFTLSLGTPSNAKAGWLGHGKSKYLPTLNIKRDPSIRIRQAVRGEWFSFSPEISCTILMVDNNVALLDRLQHTYELRNADKARMTSLSWSAVEGNLEVFEWLLMDYGHDDQELSRVSLMGLSNIWAEPHYEWQERPRNGADEQDNENNSILHILASLPSPPSSFARHPLLPPVIDTRPLEEIHTIALRMAELYIYLFPFLNNWCNSAGKSPLHIASQLGHIPMVNFLIDHGADSDLTDAQGNSALHYASAYGHLEVIKALLEAGCVHNGRNGEGFTASEFAFTERVKVELESTARAVSEGRRRQRSHGESRRQEKSGESSIHGRLRSGSVSTSGSGITSNNGSGSAHGSTSYNNSNYNYRQWAISTGTPNLTERAQYFDAPEYQQPPSRGSSPPTRRGSEGQSDRSFSHLPVQYQNIPIPPVPPMPPRKPIPHRSPSLPAPNEFRPLIIPPTPDQNANLGSAAMRRANSAQIGLGAGGRFARGMGGGSGSSDGQNQGRQRTE